MPELTTGWRAWIGSRTFADGLVGRRNAFGLLRLVLAVLVIVSHAFPVGGFGPDPFGAWTKGQAELGDLAVVGFFSLSGYLITLSAISTPLPLYLWRRFIRIMPAFWFVLIFTAAVVGPVYYALRHGGVSGYLAEPDGPGSFLVANFLLLMRQFTIHDVFIDSPYAMTGQDGGVLNGSLWTLFFEMMCYLIVGAFAVAGLLSRRRRWALPGAAVLFYASSMMIPVLGVTSFTLTELLRLGSVFLTGATIAVYRDRVPFAGRLALVCVALIVATALFGGLRTVGYVALTYLILWAAGAAPSVLHRIGAVNDLSYGVYIFAWPVQMMLAMHGVPAWGFGWYLVACLLAVVPFAAVSWWLVEKPALTLKDHPPWRWGYAASGSTALRAE